MNCQQTLGSSMKILFVDDDELAIAYGEILLSETGKVVTAQDGLEH